MRIVKKKRIALIFILLPFIGVAQFNDTIFKITTTDYDYVSFHDLEFKNENEGVLFYNGSNGFQLERKLHIVNTLNGGVSFDTVVFENFQYIDCEYNEDTLFLLTQRQSYDPAFSPVVYDFYVHRSIDNGLTWDTTYLSNVPNGTTKFSFLDNQRAVLGSSRDLRYTEDGGDNWNYIYLDDEYHHNYNITSDGQAWWFFNSVRKYKINPNTIVGADIQVFDDNCQCGGSSRIVEGNSKITAISYTGQEGWNYGYPNGNFLAMRIFNEATNVNNLVHLPNEGVLRDIDVHDTVVFLTGDGTLLKSVDKGLTYQRFAYDTPALNNSYLSFLIDFPSDSVGYLAVRNLFDDPRWLVLKTTNQGGNWVQQTQVESIFLNTEEVPKQKEISVYPNPFKEILAVSSAVLIKKLVVFDIYGKQIYQSELFNSKNVKIDLSSLASGTYVLKVFLANQHTFEHKILKP